MNDRGFTLVELVVVMAIVALVIASVPMILSGAGSGLSLKSSARNIAEGLRYSRSQAIAQNRDVRFSIDGPNRSYSVDDGRPSGNLPEDAEISYLPIAAAAGRQPSAQIFFRPDGSSTGGRLILSDDRHRIEITIHWLTGQVRISD